MCCSVLLGLADGEALPDPDVQKAALNVIINSVSGPMSRVICVLFIIGIHTAYHRHQSFCMISCCLAPDDVSATEHSASPVLLRRTACHPTFELHQHYQLLKTVSRLACFCSHTLYSLIRVAFSVRRPCSDYTDMLWRLTNCRIIIIIKCKRLE